MLWFGLANPSVSQSYSSQSSSVLATNILVNGLIGGIGGAINKDSSQRVIKAFTKNFLIGCLGGSIEYLAKYDAYNIQFDRKLRIVTQKFSFSAWGDRFLYYIGHSIVTSASMNKSIWDSYAVDLYGVNLAYSFKEKRLRPRISLSTLSSVMYFGINGHKLKLGNSLSYGLYYFSMSEKEKFDLARAGHDAIVVEEFYWNVEPILSHEFGHVWQFADYTPMNSFFKKSFSTIRQKPLIQIVDKYFILDVPYMGLFYMIQPKPWLYKNYYEFESELLGTREFVDR